MSSEPRQKQQHHDVQENGSPSSFNRNAGPPVDPEEDDPTQIPDEVNEPRA